MYKQSTMCPVASRSGKGREVLVASKREEQTIRSLYEEDKSKTNLICFFFLVCVNNTIYFYVKFILMLMLFQISIFWHWQLSFAKLKHRLRHTFSFSLIAFKFVFISLSVHISFTLWRSDCYFLRSFLYYSIYFNKCNFIKFIHCVSLVSVSV